MNELQLHDIKPLITIPDYSFYIFSLLIASAVIIVLAIIYFIYRYFKNRQSLQMKNYKQLQSLTFEDSKATAYTITKLGSILVQSEREKKLFEELLEDLQQYKYKKVVESFSTPTLQKFKLFMDAVDVK